MKFDIILPHPEQLSSNLGYGGEGGGRHSIHKESHTHHLRPLARLTEALYAEKANTHLIDESNETTIELMLETLVSEKRSKLQHWLREQEEMTQCLWPADSITNKDYEKRDSADKQSAWRDSGLGGNRSSSDAHTSDIDDETHAAHASTKNNNTNRKKKYSSSEGSPGSNHKYQLKHQQHPQQQIQASFEKSKTSSASSKESKGRLSREENYQQQQQQSNLEKSKTNFSRKESVKSKLSRTNSATSRRKDSITQQQQPPQQHSEPQQPQQKTKPKLSNKTSSGSSGSQFQRRKSKARSMWNAIIDKVRTVGAIVTEKSGEATFKSSSFDLSHNDVTDSNNYKEDGNQDTEETSPVLNNKNYYNSHEHVYDSIENFKQNNSSISINTTTATINNNKSEPPTARSKSQGGYYNNHPTRNRPIIENSRTISTASMFEIGKSEIGDVENLHLLPSQALIYLSGQCGEHAFKRIIPFQLEVEGAVSGGESMNTDTTIHQLAAKSIIHDLELQMEHDDGMLEDHGKIYIR